jgi:hypothetical protein
MLKTGRQTEYTKIVKAFPFGQEMLASSNWKIKIYEKPRVGASKLYEKYQKKFNRNFSNQKFDCLRSVGIDHATRAWKCTVFSGEESIDLASCLTTLGDGPNDKRLSTTAIAGSEYLGIWCSVRSVGRLNVATIVQRQTWLGKEV